MSLDLDYRSRIEGLTRKLDQLLLTSPILVQDYRERVPRSTGIYVFSEVDSRWLYVGISVGKKNNLRSRIGQHIPNIPPSRPRKGSAAILAERIAMESIGLDGKGLSKERMYSQHDFRDEFFRLRHRIENMDLRWLTLEDKQQAQSLEAFAVLVLQPKYNLSINSNS